MKPENILINIEVNTITGRKAYTAKIADFGLSAEYKCNIYAGN
jgi:serine/threonine protein kinase